MDSDCQSHCPAPTTAWTDGRGGDLRTGWLPSTTPRNEGREPGDWRWRGVWPLDVSPSTSSSYVAGTTSQKGYTRRMHTNTTLQEDIYDRP